MKSCPVYKVSDVFMNDTSRSEKEDQSPVTVETSGSVTSRTGSMFTSSG